MGRLYLAGQCLCGYRLQDSGALNDTHIGKEMNSHFILAVSFTLFIQSFWGLFLPQKTVNPIAAFSFSENKYFHRYTKGDQHEYTPNSQEDLNAWTEMVTINLYRRVRAGEALAATANAVLENYKAHGAVVVKTASVPRTKAKPAEHFIVVSFNRPEFIEAAFARFRMHNGFGCAVIYSHRVYGINAGNEMRAWLAKNGLVTEKNLMTWDAMPKLEALK